MMDESIFLGILIVIMGLSWSWLWIFGIAFHSWLLLAASEIDMLAIYFMGNRFSKLTKEYLNTNAN